MLGPMIQVGRQIIICILRLSYDGSARKFQVGNNGKLGGQEEEKQF